MFESIIRAFDEKFGINLVDIVEDFLSDGSPACAAAIARFPRLEITNTSLASEAD